MKGPIALLLASVLLVLLLGELAVRLVAPQIWVPGEAEPDWLMHRRSRDPLLVYELRPGARILFPREHGRGTVTFEINALGWRDRAMASPAKPPGRKRVLVLGDSIAFGLGVELHETLGRRLEDELRGRGLDVECVTLAVSGYDALQSVHTLYTKGLAFEPDLVVFEYNLTDTMHFSGELGQFFEALAYGQPLPGDGLRRALVPGSQLARWLFWRLARLRPPDADRVRFTEKRMDEARAAYVDTVLARHPEEPAVSEIPRRVPAADPPLPEPWNMVEEGHRDPASDRNRRAALLDLADFARETKIPVVVGLIPAFVDRQPYPFEALEGELVAEMKRFGLPVVPLRGVLGEGAVYELSYDSLHPTARGHALLAQRLAEGLLHEVPSLRPTPPR